jgi:hypothetical protein
MTTSLVTYRPGAATLTLAIYAEIVSREVARLDAADLLPIPADLLRWHFERGVPALQAAADIAQFTS